MELPGRASKDEAYNLEYFLATHFEIIIYWYFIIITRLKTTTLILNRICLCPVETNGFWKKFLIISTIKMVKNFDNNNSSKWRRTSRWIWIWRKLILKEIQIIILNNSSIPQENNSNYDNSEETCKQ